MSRSGVHGFARCPSSWSYSRQRQWQTLQHISEPDRTCLTFLCQHQAPGVLRCSLRCHTEEAHTQLSCSVIPTKHSLESGAKHGGWALDVQPIATILVLMIMQVALHLCFVGICQHQIEYPGDVAADDQARHEEHGATIVPRPMSIFSLSHVSSCHDTRYFTGRQWCLHVMKLQQAQS